MPTERRERSAPSASRSATRRCAIYTRKSSEEGLEQAFNSLDAQREACEAYIRSQCHEGWTALANRYDDGGISGGTLERPALQRLLADIRAGRLDLVVVYKVDRLTRSLADFAKIVEAFDAAGVSFVSVTQQFNTTTSMGRLTLNMLLSFAQFEREVTGERIRDKFAASRRKGMWMGGTVPLGYEVRDRKLVANEAEAATVRRIYAAYLALGSVRLLHEQLKAEGVVGKSGRPLGRGALFHLLQNRVYRGEVVHKGNVYPGEQAAIVDQALWDAAQTRLAENRGERSSGERAGHPSLLVGLLHDGCSGERLTPSHAVKAGRRYRYYVSRALIIQGRGTAPAGRRVPAGDVERLVTERVRQFLASDAEVFAVLRPALPDAAVQRQLLDRAARLAHGWAELAPSEGRTKLRDVLARVELHADRLDLHLLPSRLVDLLRDGTDRAGHPALSNTAAAPPLILSVPVSLRRAGREMALVVGTEPGVTPGPDPSLLRLVLKARALWDTLLEGAAAGLGELAAREGVSGSYATRLVRLAFLAPDLLAAILDGRQPEGLTAAALLRECRRGLPPDWRAQRILLGFS
ncbi:MAG TPA: recombinase family protein [Falsiroseomonas sp.]|jgi:DNA invertase Pin-like site-specific DNA recombinase|nr:recombinase family protein [Falsiroseomonas sp.]